MGLRATKARVRLDGLVSVRDGERVSWREVRPRYRCADKFVVVDASGHAWRTVGGYAGSRIGQRAWARAKGTAADVLPHPTDLRELRRAFIMWEVGCVLVVCVGAIVFHWIGEPLWRLIPVWLLMAIVVPAMQPASMWIGARSRRLQRQRQRDLARRGREAR